ncbi:AGE family epimerase/isomerase [Chitinophaga alhagiae]|uniref:AGE family epimerase/isomerase n=1 Tax=Chitinophaga alhagiae TaxID=2203219 RepID=UPI000E5C267C|nr:AGE family epimerase/isomerase [Chitinophaga alhagiae]
MQEKLKQELQAELNAILDFWLRYSIDEKFGGFYGKLFNNNAPDPFAIKGAVLNAGILRAFAAGYSATQHPPYLQAAHRAFSYMVEYFLDNEYGGVVWSVDYTGNPVETKKQVYAIARVIDAFAEYYKITQHKVALDRAIGLYSLVQLYSYDCVNGGYVQAFSRDWKDIRDLRMFTRDANEKKSAGTHLQLLEAYVNLYAIWPDEGLKTHIHDLLVVFYDKIIDKTSAHLQLFFENDWKLKSTHISYGYDMAASWLLPAAAEATGDEAMLEKLRPLALQMAEAGREGQDADGGFWNEFAPEHKHLVPEKLWWPQAEGIIAFINAWQLSNNPAYLQYAQDCWQFVCSYLQDKKGGEWFWGVRKDNTLMDEEKIGLWKSPFHHSRACLEAMKRL